MSVTLRCPPVPRETRKKTGVTVSRAIICHPVVAAAGERRADCCSSLSPISDCFFKAPVAEDINYPASVNHVIYRPRLRGLRGDGGTEGGEGWRKRRKRRRRMRKRRRGSGRIRRGSCCTMRWCCIAASRVKRPSTALHGRSNILLAVPEIYRRLARNFRLARWLRLTARRGRPHLPRRSIDLPPPGSRANPPIGGDAGRAARFFTPRSVTRFSLPLVNSSRAATARSLK